MTTRAWTTADLMACVVSRLLRDGERVFFGVASPLVMVGTLLARETHAPNLVVLNIPGGMGPRVPSLDASTVHARLLEGSPYLFTLAEVFDLSARGGLDTAFLSGVQIDREGCINMSVIGEMERPRVALPGGAGSALILPTARRTILWRTRHDRRSLVERLDYRTACGNTSHLVTPLCLFERRGGRLEVASVHPGVSVEQVRENTGWDIGPGPFPETPPPTEEELDALARIDPRRVREAEFR